MFNSVDIKKKLLEDTVPCNVIDGVDIKGYVSYEIKTTTPLFGRKKIKRVYKNTKVACSHVIQETLANPKDTTNICGKKLAQAGIKSYEESIFSNNNDYYGYFSKYKCVVGEYLIKKFNDFE